jgi:hypothetical protein
MKKAILALVLALSAAGRITTAHEAVTIGPNGGRVVYLDSSAVPNVEFLVNAEGRAEVYLLDRDRKPLKADTITVAVTTGPRSRVKKLEVAREGVRFVTSPLPDGAPYYIVAQIRTGDGAKALIARLNYDPTPAESGKPAYLDDSVNAEGGENIAVPDTPAGIWAELNQHQVELVENIAKKRYEAIDEVTRAYPVLAKGLADCSGDLPAASGLIETLLKHLAAVRTANAARTLDTANQGMEGITATLKELKALYPAGVANAKP